MTDLEKAISDLTPLDCEIEELDKKGLDLDERLHAARRKVVKLAFRVEAGTVVKSGDDRYVVTKVDTYFCWHVGHKPWLSGHKIKADGSQGKIDHHLYEDWIIE